MLKKLGFGFSIVGTLIFSIAVVNTPFSSSATAQHYQVLQPDGKEVVKEGEKKEGKEGAKAEGEKEEMCEKCKHLPSKPEGDCRCDCHHRHK